MEAMETVVKMVVETLGLGERGKRILKIVARFNCNNTQEIQVKSVFVQARSCSGRHASSGAVGQHHLPASQSVDLDPDSRLHCLLQVDLALVRICCGDAEGGGEGRGSCADQSDNDVTGSGDATPTMIR